MAIVRTDWREGQQVQVEFSLCFDADPSARLVGDQLLSPGSMKRGSMLVIRGVSAAEGAQALQSPAEWFAKNEAKIACPGVAVRSSLPAAPIFLAHHVFVFVAAAVDEGHRCRGARPSPPARVGRRCAWPSNAKKVRSTSGRGCQPATIRPPSEQDDGLPSRVAPQTTRILARDRYRTAS